MRMGFKWCLGAWLLAACHWVAAQDFPSKPITMVMPYAPGGPGDTITRVFAGAMQKVLGQQIVVDNTAGASGSIGTAKVARAKPDGYTLLTGNVGTQSINPTLYRKLNYNPDTSFVPIGLFAELPFVLATTASLPAKNVKELVELAKANPNQLTYASSGNGGSPHLSAETFKIATGTQILHVPYKGGGAAMTDLISGNVHMLFASVLETSAYIKAGKLKALAITSKERVSAMPDVPTLQESGVTGAESGSWLGLLAPAGTPPEVVEKISRGLQQVVTAPDVQQQLLAQGAIAKTGTPQDFVQLIANDRKRYARIILDNKLTID